MALVDRGIRFGDVRFDSSLREPADCSVFTGK